MAPAAIRLHTEGPGSVVARPAGKPLLHIGHSRRFFFAGIEYLIMTLSAFQTRFRYMKVVAVDYVLCAGRGKRDVSSPDLSQRSCCKQKRQNRQAQKKHPH
jgi:hypothetical protein